MLLFATFVALDRILKINSSSDTKKNCEKKKKNVVFIFFVGAPGTFNEKCKTIFTKTVNYFFLGVDFSRSTNSLIFFLEFIF